MREHFALTLNFEEVENGWIQVEIEEFPEVVTAAPSHREARLAALDALREYLASFGEDERPPMREHREPAWTKYWAEVGFLAEWESVGGPKSETKGAIERAKQSLTTPDSVKKPRSQTRRTRKTD
jgi:predicted RNase H-like HicB family nuclease